MQYFKRWLVCAALLLTPAAVSGIDPREIQQQTEVAIQTATERGWLDVDQEQIDRRVASYQEDAQQLAERASNYVNQVVHPTFQKQFSFSDALDLSQLEVPLAMDVPQASDDSASCSEHVAAGGWRLFISASMSQSELGRAIRYARDRSIPLYLKGFMPAESPVAATFQALIKVAQDFGPDVQMGVHPDEFAAFNVDRVPAIAYREGEKQWVVRGMYSKEWLQDRIESEEYAQGEDFGVIGKVYTILEPDAKVLMQQQLANYDWKEKQRQAIKRFWSHQPMFPDLPEAEEHSQWYIDPTVRLTGDIKNGKGQYLGHKGDVINPLKDVRAHLTLLIFDPSNRDQLRWVGETIPTLGYRKVMPIATHLDQRNGWDQLEALTRRLGLPVFMLKADLKDKFYVKQTPTVIETEDAHFRVQEIAKEWLINNKGLPTL